MWVKAEQKNLYAKFFTLLNLWLSFWRQYIFPLQFMNLVNGNMQSIWHKVICLVLYFLFVDPHGNWQATIHNKKLDEGIEELRKTCFRRKFNEFNYFQINLNELKELINYSKDPSFSYRLYIPNKKSKDENSEYYWKL